MFLDWFKKLQSKSVANNRQEQNNRQQTNTEDVPKKPVPDLTERQRTTTMSLFDDK